MMGSITGDIDNPGNQNLIAYGQFFYYFDTDW